VDRTAITGTVTDQQGNRVPECRVRATERATGFERQAVTTSQGNYADFSLVNFGTISTTISNYATGRGTPREFQLSAKISF
jgi:hypothetical protein